MNEVSASSGTRPLRFIAGIVLLSALFPYLSPFPVPGLDVQPFAMVVSVVAVLGTLLLVPRRVSIVPTDLGILFSGVLMLVYVNPAFVPLDLAWLRTCGTVLMGFVVYYAVRLLYPYMSASLIVGTAVAYAGALVVQILAPSLYLAVVPHLLSQVGWIPGGIRGPNGLCVEPSMNANISIVLVLLTMFFHREYWEQHSKLRMLVWVCAMAMALLSQSASGIVLWVFMLLVGLLMFRITLWRKLALAACLALPLVLYGLFVMSTETRLGYFTREVATDPAYLVRDASAVARYIQVYLAFSTLQEAPLGTGKLEMDETLSASAWNKSFTHWLIPHPNMQLHVRNFIRRVSVTSGIGPMLERMGLCLILILGFLLSRLKGTNHDGLLRIFVGVMLLNASLITPVIWLMIGCCTAIRVAMRAESSRQPELQPRS